MLRGLLIALMLLAAPFAASAGPLDDLRAGLAAQGRDDLDEAIGLYTSAIEADELSREDRAIGFNNRASAYLAKGLKDRAIADYDAAIGLSPDYAHAFNGRGVVYRVKGFDDLAIADFDVAIWLDPDYFDGYYNRAVALGAKGQHDRAVADHEAAMRLRPDHPFPFNGRGNVYRAMGLNDRAIGDYDTAIRLKPDFAEALYNRGDAYRAVGLNNLAIADLNAALDVAPNDSRAFNSRGLAYVATGLLDRGLADFDSAIRLRPGDAGAYRNRGDVHRYMARHLGAVANYDAAIGLGSETAQVYFGRGVSKFALGRFGEAARDHEIVLAIAAGDDYARVALWLHVARRRIGDEGAAELLSNVDKIDLDTWPGLVVKLYLGGAAPTEVLAAAEDLDPGTRSARLCFAYFFIGQHYLIGGDMGGAARMFRRAMDTGLNQLAPYQGAAAELRRMGLLK